MDPDGEPTGASMEPSYSILGYGTHGSPTLIFSGPVFSFLFAIVGMHYGRGWNGAACEWYGLKS